MITFNSMLRVSKFNRKQMRHVFETLSSVVRIRSYVIEIRQFLKASTTRFCQNYFRGISDFHPAQTLAVK